MQVTIVGAGNMGRGIGSRLVAGGHEVEIRDRDDAEAAAMAAELSGSGSGGASSASADAPFAADVVVLALPYPSALAVAEQRVDELAGKIVVDITNPVDWATFDGLVTPPGSSAAEEIAKAAPRARVVKAFNTTFAGTLVQGHVADQPLDVFLASDDADAKTVVSELVAAGGLRPLDVGPLRRARELEATGFLHMVLQQPMGTGYGSALRVVS